MREYNEIVKEHGEQFQLKFALPFCLKLVDSLRLDERFPSVYELALYRMTALHGRRNSKLYTRLFFAQIVAGEFIVFVFTLFLLLAAGDGAVFFLGAVLLIVLPMLFFKDADRKIRRKRQAILLELPLILGQLILLLNAGETLQQALIRIGESERKEKHPLIIELQTVALKLKNRTSLFVALEDMNKNCGVQEVSLFINALLLNYKRGGSEFVSVLSTLSHQLWESRKNTAKQMGEEASSKLIFPMVVIFLIVLIVVSTPAIQMMK